MRKKTGHILIVLSLLPILAMLVFFFASPALGALFFSLTDQMLVGQRSDEVSFIGLDNYIRLLGDPHVYMALVNSGILLAGALTVQQALGFSIARLLAGKALPFKKFVHGCVYSGWLMPEVVTAFVFFLLFSVEGLLNSLIQSLGGRNVAWLIDYPLLVIVLAQVWSGTAFSLITYETALDSVPDSCVDSARTDGATARQILFCVLIPSIGHTVRTNTLVLTLNNIGVFGLIYMLTGGGPLFRSTNLPVLVFRTAISGSATGYGLTLTFVLFSLSIFISLLHARAVQE